MSLANKITIARAGLIPATLALLLLGKREAALACFLLASLGDVLDGIAARARHEVSLLGKVLDPAVDKVMYASLIAAFTSMGDISLAALILYFIPQIGLGIGAIVLHRRARRVQGARLPGKAAAVLTFIAVVFLFLGLPYRVMVLYVAIGVGYGAALDYLRAACSPGQGTSS